MFQSYEHNGQHSACHIDYTNESLRAGKLALFEDNKIMSQMLDNPFEWAEFIKQFEN